MVGPQRHLSCTSYRYASSTAVTEPCPSGHLLVSGICALCGRVYACSDSPISCTETIVCGKTWRLRTKPRRWILGRRGDAAQAVSPPVNILNGSAPSQHTLFEYTRRVDGIFGLTSLSNPEVSVYGDVFTRVVNEGLRRCAMVGRGACECLTAILQSNVYVFTRFDGFIFFLIAPRPSFLTAGTLGQAVPASPV